MFIDAWMDCAGLCNGAMTVGIFDVGFVAMSRIVDVGVSNGLMSIVLARGALELPVPSDPNGVPG